MANKYRRALKTIPCLSNKKNRKSFAQKLQTMTRKELNELTPIQIMNHVPQFTQAQGIGASCLGQTLQRTENKKVDQHSKI